MAEPRFVNVSPSVWTRVGDVEVYNMLGCVIVAQVDAEGAVITFGPSKVRPVKAVRCGELSLAVVVAPLVVEQMACTLLRGHEGWHEAHSGMPGAPPLRWVVPTESVEPCGEKFHGMLSPRSAGLTCVRPAGHEEWHEAPSALATDPPLKWIVPTEEHRRLFEESLPPRVMPTVGIARDDSVRSVEDELAREYAQRALSQCGHKHSGLAPLALSCQKKAGHIDLAHHARTAAGEPLITWWGDSTGSVDVGNVRYASAELAVTEINERGIRVASDGRPGATRSGDVRGADLARSIETTQVKLRRANADAQRAQLLDAQRRRPPHHDV